MPVADRPGLEAATCECYGAVRREFGACSARPRSRGRGTGLRRLMALAGLSCLLAFGRALAGFQAHLRRRPAGLPAHLPSARGHRPGRGVGFAHAGAVRAVVPPVRPSAKEIGMVGKAEYPAAHRGRATPVPNRLEARTAVR
jgi:hypothetical protein